jgi:hypothetical protein
MAQLERGKTMATYKVIRAYISQHNGFNVETCHIAEVKADHGLTGRLAPNRIDPFARVKPCPLKNRKAIESALKHFGLISS